MKVACLIPAYNEAERIGETVRILRSVPEVDEIIVIDDASTDGTAEEARRSGADSVISLPRNLGKGGAMNRGFAASNADILLLLDADIGSSAKEAARLLAPIISGQADMAIAVLHSPFSIEKARPAEKMAGPTDASPGQKGGFGLAVRLARWGIRRLAGLTVQAPLSGLRAVRREVIESIGGFESRWAVEIGLTVAAARAGFRIIEIPTAFAHRATGRGIRGFLHRGRQFLDVARYILTHWK